jgi:ATP-binding cassette subfamily F protein uup
MNYLSVESLSKRYGVKELFTDVSFGLEKGQKTALIARNGTGKTTLLKCIVGQETPDSGIVTMRNGITLGFLDQQAEMETDRSVLDEVLGEDSPVTNAIRAYQKALRDGGQKKIQHAMEDMDHHHAWDHEARVLSLLHKLGLKDPDQSVKTLSGGQKKRVALTKVMSGNPDVLILDEPTNHLDLDMIEWLEQELSAPHVTLLLVTHDRYFLDRICDEIVELEDGTLHRYKGNYSYYVEKKALNDDVAVATTAKHKSLMRKELEWVRRMPKARGTKSKSRLQDFKELKQLARKKHGHDEVELGITTTRLGGKVIEVRSLVKRFGDFPIVEKFDYSFKKNDRIGLVGPNGVGKSTFIELITGKMPPDGGKVVIGDTVVLGHYDQQGLQLKSDKRVIEVVKDIAEIIPMAKGKKMTASQLLERFLFDKEQQWQYVSTLSGGEKRRLYLCQVLMANPNVIILDEPTNDLDLATLSTLESFLMELEACIIVVSHDRYFLDKICDFILEFKGNGVIKEFVGTYSELREKRQQESTEKPSVKPVKKVQVKPKSKKITYGEKLELEKLDTEIPQLETDKKALTLSLSEQGIGHTELSERAAKLESIIKKLEILESRWLELSEKADNS